MLNLYSPDIFYPYPFAFCCIAIKNREGINGYAVSWTYIFLDPWKSIRQDCKSWLVLNAVWGWGMKIWIGRKNSSICVVKPAPGFRPCCATCRLVPIRWSGSWPLAASSKPPGPGQHWKGCLHSSWMGRRGEKVFSIYHLNAWGNSGQYFLQEKVF